MKIQSIPTTYSGLDSERLALVPKGINAEFFTTDADPNLGGKHYIWTGAVWRQINPGGGPGGAAWGSITGTLSSQVDLQSALDDKTTLPAVKADADIADAIIKKHSNSLDHSNANDPSSTEKAALAGTAGSPSGTNKFVTNADARNTDARAPTAHSHTPAEAGAEPANSNIQTHVTSAHAPSDAQKNSDITKAEIEAKLTGEISSHTHAGGSGTPEIWMSKVHAAYGDGDPYDAAQAGLSAAVAISPVFTPTNIGVTVGRLVAFRFTQPITVANVRWYGIAAVSGIYTAAIYRDSDGARLWAPGAISTLANAWSSAAWAQTLLADTLYWLGIGASTTGTTAGFCGPNRPREAAMSLANPAFAGLSAVGLRWSQVALTAGSWPATLPTKVNAVAWTGSIPIFYLCASGY